MFLVFACAFACVSFAAERPAIVDAHDSVIHAGSLEMMQSASRDTVHLIGPWGSGAVVNGQFENPNGGPDWNGWTSVDLTQRTDARWHIDTYNVVSGVYSVWCGNISYAACTVTDTVGGYGSGWNELKAIVRNPVCTIISVAPCITIDGQIRKEEQIQKRNGQQDKTIEKNVGSICSHPIPGTACHDFSMHVLSPG